MDKTIIYYVVLVLKSLKVFRLKAAILGLKFVNLVMFIVVY